MILPHIRTYLALLLALIAAEACAQFPSPGLRFHHIGVEQGLSQNIVTAITQDQQGFIWCGTENGLNRYDGYATTVYQNNLQDPASLPANVIYALAVDSTGYLWVGSSAGLSSVLPGRSSFRPHRGSGTTRLPDGAVTAMVVDRAGFLWCAFRDSVYRIAVADGQCLAASLIAGGLPCILTADRTGNVWLATGGRVARYDPSTGALQWLPTSPSDNGYQIVAIAVNGDSVLWTADVNGNLFRTALRSGTRNQYRRTSPMSSGPGENVLITLLVDSRGVLWIGHFAGLDYRDPFTEEFVHFRERKRDPAALLGERIYALFEDRAGIVWAGSYHGGLNRIDPTRNRFDLLLPVTDDSHDEENAVLSIWERGPDDVWVATHHGVRRMRLSNGAWRRTPVIGTRSAFLENYQITSLCEDSAKHLWAGTEFGVCRINLTTGSEHWYAHDDRRPGSLSQNEVHVIFCDIDGDVWIGTEKGGINRYDRLHDAFVRYQNDARDPGSFPSLGAWAIVQERNGTLWIGGWNGGFLTSFDKRTQVFTPWPNRADDSTSIRSNATRAVCEDSAGRLWFGTWGGGVNCLDRSTGRFSHLSTNNGLPSAFVKSMLLDKHQDLWIATENGVARYSPATGAMRIFTEHDGLQGQFFYSNAGVMGNSGRIYFGGTNGLTAFVPESVVVNSHIPPVVITGMRVFDAPHELPHAGEEQQITLHYDQNFFSFDFVALDYADPARNSYAYIMDGLDPAWTMCGTRRYAAYTNLPPGSYTFRVQGANPDGTWNIAGASLRILITPPFWVTWWFRAGVVIVLLVTLWGISRYRINQAIAVERLRSRIAADLHDEIGSELSSIALASQLLVAKLVLPEKEQRQLSAIGVTALRASSRMKEIVWLINPRNDSLDDLILKMKDVAEQVLGDVPYTFAAPPDPLTATIDLAAKRHLYLMFKEILTNISRHAAARSVRILVRWARGRLTVEISDDGRGFEVATVHKGNGLANCRERARQLRADLSIQSAIGTGTTVVIVAQMPQMRHRLL